MWGENYALQQPKIGMSLSQIVYIIGSHFFFVCLFADTIPVDACSAGVWKRQSKFEWNNYYLWPGGGQFPCGHLAITGPTGLE